MYIGNNMRRPTKKEILSISQIICKNNLRQIRIGALLIILLLVNGLILIINSFINSQITVEKLIIFFLCYFFTIPIFLFLKDLKKENEIFSKGDFKICEGTIFKVKKSKEKSKYINIWFISNDKSFNNGWFKIRKDDLGEDNNIILVLYELKQGSELYSQAFPKNILS